MPLFLGQNLVVLIRMMRIEQPDAAMLLITTRAYLARQVRTEVLSPFFVFNFAHLLPF